MRWYSLLFVCCLLFSQSCSPRNTVSFKDAVTTALSLCPATTGIYAKHLKTGQEVAIRADVAFNSASVIKLAVMALAYDLADRQKLNLDEGVEITRRHLREGSAALQSRIGQSVCLRDLITAMITVSDNAAAEIMIERVGGKDQVNQWLQHAGFSHTALQFDNLAFTGLLRQLDPEWNALTPEEATGLTFALNNEIELLEMYRPLFSGPKAHWINRARVLASRDESRTLFRQWLVNPSNWLGSVTARDAAGILEGIESERIASQAGSKEMREVLLQQKLGGRRIPQFIRYPVGHKTGDLPPMVANDVGIVYSDSGPIVIAVLTADNTGPPLQLDDQIGRISQFIVEHFDNAAGTGQ